MADKQGISTTRNHVQFYRYFIIHIFWFSPCVCLIFSEAFSAAWRWRASSEFLHQESLVKYLAIEDKQWSPASRTPCEGMSSFFIYWYFLFSLCVCLIFSEAFPTAWWWRASRKFPASGAIWEGSGVCLVFFVLLTFYLFIFLLSPSVSLIFSEIFSVERRWRGRRELQHQEPLEKVCPFLIDIIVLTLCLPYFFRNLFSSDDGGQAGRRSKLNK